MKSTDARFGILAKVGKALYAPLFCCWPLILGLWLLWGWNSWHCLGFWIVHPGYPDVGKTLWHVTSGLGYSALIAYLGGALVHLVRKKWIVISLYTVALLWFIPTFWMYLICKNPISVNSLGLLMQTDWAEARAMGGMLLTSWQPWVAVGTGALVVIGCSSISRYKRRFRIIGKMTGVMVSIFCGLGIYWLSILPPLLGARNLNDIEGWISSHGIMTDPRVGNDLLKTMMVLKVLQQERGTMRGFISRTKVLLDNGMGPEEVENPMKVVLVIGESHNKSHSQLYGYPLATNPRLEAMRDSTDLIVMNDAVSPFAFTMGVLRYMFSSIGVTDSARKWHDGVYMPAVFKAQGWEVNLWDNQTPFNGADAGIWENTLYVLLYPKEVSQSMYDQVNIDHKTWDMDFVRHHLNNNSATRNSLEIWHLQGQHFPPSLPQDAVWEVFNPDDYEWTVDSKPWLKDSKTKRQFVADYDNACQYNDSVQALIIDSYKDSTAVVVYLSDHGEDPYESGDIRGRAGALSEDFSWERAQALTEVPMWVWISDKYQASYPEKAQALRRASNKPILTTDIFQMLMGLGGLDVSPFYDARLDPLTDEYRCPKRLVNGKFDYDRMRARQHKKAVNLPL